MSTKIVKNYKCLIGLPLAAGLLNEASGGVEFVGVQEMEPIPVSAKKLDIPSDGCELALSEEAFKSFEGKQFKTDDKIDNIKVVNFLEKLCCERRGIDPIVGLIPQTDSSVLTMLEPFKREDVTWHPLWARMFVNGKWDYDEAVEVGYSDDVKLEMKTADPEANLKISRVKTSDGSQASSEQIAFFLNSIGGYGIITTAIFANDNNILGGVNDKNSFVLLNVAQEEQVGHCFPNLYDMLYKKEVCIPYLTEITESGGKRFSFLKSEKTNDKEIKELFSALGGKEKVVMDKAAFEKKAREQLVLPRYAYKKPLAPAPDVIGKKEGGEITCPEGITPRSLYVKNAKQAFVSTSKPIEGLRNSFENKNLFGYNPITLFAVNLVFTAAIDLRNVVKSINAFISLSYFKACVSILEQQMRALGVMETKTLITGNMGCGIFRNDYRVVALAYAYVLKNCRPKTLENVVIADGNFYQTLSEVWECVDDTKEATYSEFFVKVSRAGENSVLNPNGGCPYQIKMDPSRYGERQQLCPAYTKHSDVFDAISSRNQDKINQVAKSLTDEDVASIRRNADFFVNRESKTLRNLCSSVVKGFTLDSLKTRLQIEVK